VSRPKSSNTAAIIGLVLLAIVGGVYIGTSIYNEQQGTPMPAPPKVDLNDAYDDNWGKLTSADAQAVVTHILVGWTGANPRSTPKQPRSKEEARKLIDQIWAKFRVNPTDDNWKALQKQYNEDDQVDVHNKYTCKANDGLDPAFSACGKSTKPGHARVTETAFGFHLIKRE
jgi:hypothetical protein